MAVKCIIVRGTIIWQITQNGKRHRSGDRPAWIDKRGTVKFYKDGEIHRDGDMPAVISSGGYMAYYEKGLFHRDGGKPARIYSEEIVEYWKKGRQYWPKPEGSK